MSGRIYTGAEARAMLVGTPEIVASNVLAAAPDLAASVEHWHAEHGRAEERSRLHAAEGQRLGVQLGNANARAVAAEMERDAAVAHAEELTRALTTLRAAVREYLAADDAACESAVSRTVEPYAAWRSRQREASERASAADAALRALVPTEAPRG